MTTLFDTTEDMERRLARIGAVERALAATPDSHPLKPVLEHDLQAHHLEHWSPHNQPPSYWHTLNSVERSDTFEQKVRRLIHSWLGLCMSPGDTDDARRILEDSEVLLLHIVRAAQVHQGLITDEDYEAMLDHATLQSQTWHSSFYDRHPDAIWDDVRQSRAYQQQQQQLYPLDYAHDLREQINETAHALRLQPIDTNPRLEHEHAHLSALLSYTEPNPQRARTPMRRTLDMLRALERAWCELIDEPLNIERQANVRKRTRELLATIRGDRP
jgi:hypothetical protein